jgi:molybdopterin-guanine dinucleotide biosynthesis protein B
MKKTPIQIIGHPGSGKTTLIVEIIEELIKKELTVGTIKHSAHHHELDKPGKDSYMHRKAGAIPAAMMTKDMIGIYLPKKQNQYPDDLIEQYFSQTDIVLIEGWIGGPHDKIEVFRNSCKRKPLFYDIQKVKALIIDHSINSDYINDAKIQKIQIIDRYDISQLIDFILLHKH